VSALPIKVICPRCKSKNLHVIQRADVTHEIWGINQEDNHEPTFDYGPLVSINNSTEDIEVVCGDCGHDFGGFCNAGHFTQYFINTYLSKEQRDELHFNIIYTEYKSAWQKLARL